MSLKEQTVDQWVTKAVEKHAEFLETSLGIKNDLPKAKSACFVALCAESVLGLSDEEARECIVEGGNDFGVDGLHIADVADVEFTVTLFQGKYHQSLEGTKGFPMSGIEKLVRAIDAIFDPKVDVEFNDRLKERVEDIRSLIHDENIPRVRVIFCSNGTNWAANGQEVIDRAQSSQIKWDAHLGAEELIGLKESTASINAQLHLSGVTLVEDYDYRRVAIGKIRVAELAALFEKEGDKLLERNVRRYLGQVGRVNKGIEATLTEASERPNFYFYNNGITLICTKFSFNALQRDDQIFRVEGMSVINGGQTCKTIQHVLKSLPADTKGLDEAFVLVRLYELPEDDVEFVRRITYATNSQNPVDLRDLQSNESVQKRLESSLASLNFNYARYRSQSNVGRRVISSARAAEAVLAVWRRKPQLSKNQRSEHFGRLYDFIFTPDLNGAQVVVAVEIFRYVERRRRAQSKESARFVPYATAVISMLIGDSLLTKAGYNLSEVDHNNLDGLRAALSEHQDSFYDTAVTRISAALKSIYAEASLDNGPLHRLAGYFRRGDLMEALEETTSSMGDPK
jgi:hypothetical protein